VGGIDAGRLKYCNVCYLFACWDEQSV